MILCAQQPSNPEFSLCGDAEDGFETEDDMPPIYFADVGQIVSCPVCLEILAALREDYAKNGKRRSATRINSRLFVPENAGE